MFLKDGKFGKYYACLDPSCRGSRKYLVGKKCPQCFEELFETVFEGKQVYFCTGYSLTGCKYKEELEKPELLSIIQSPYQDRLNKSLKSKK